MNFKLPDECKKAAGVEASPFADDDEEEDWGDKDDTWGKEEEEESSPGETVDAKQAEEKKDEIPDFVVSDVAYFT